METTNTKEFFKADIVSQVTGKVTEAGVLHVRVTKVVDGVKSVTERKATDEEKAAHEAKK